VFYFRPPVFGGEVRSNLTTSGQVQARATLELERRRRAVAEGSILIAPQPAQELYDVIALTHAGLPLSNARKRVRGWRLSPTRQESAPPTTRPSS